MSWLKIDKATPRKPEILKMASDLGLHPDHVFGLCFRFWSWCDDQLSDCHANGVTNVTVDALVGRDGFAAAMIGCNWLIVTEHGIEIPNFDYHLSQSSKARAQATIRQNKKRTRVTQDVTKMSRSKRDKSVTVEKRREDKNTNTEEALALVRDDLINPSDMLVSWNRSIGLVPVRSMTAKRIKALRARERDPVFIEHWRDGIERVAASDFCCGGGSTGWRADIDWFLRPDTLLKVLEGKYDNGSGTAGPSVGKSREQDRIERSLAACQDFAENG